MSDEYYVFGKDAAELALLADKNNIPKYHSLEEHNWHIKRYKHCLYCEQGSEPAPKVMLEELNGVR